jgi:Fe-S-cluster-containing dehydrogenase component
VRYRRVLNFWRGEYPEIRSFSLSLACLHCVEPACAAVCPSEAIIKQDKDGLVVVDEMLCTGCRLCAEACPFEVPQFGESGVMQKCDLCHSRQQADCGPPCVDTCPGKALSFIKVSSSEKRKCEQETARVLSSGAA